MTCLGGSADGEPASPPVAADVVLACARNHAAELPEKARIDALHVATAAVNGMDYLLTWNCKQIANATLRGKIEEICRSAGFAPPIICTPIELSEDEP